MVCVCVFVCLVCVCGVCVCVCVCVWCVCLVVYVSVLCSSKGSDVELSSSNTPPRELYRIILSELNDENLMMVTTGRNM